MSSYIHNMPPKPNKMANGSESIQFTFNKKPFPTRDKAIDALCAKNLLPAEPAVAFYYDENKKMKMILAVGTVHNLSTPLFIEDKDTIIGELMDLKNVKVDGLEVEL